MGIGKTRKVRAPTWNDLFHRRGPWRQLDHQKLKLHVRYLQLRFLRPGEKLLEIHSMDHLEGGAAGSSATNRKRQEKKQNSSLIDALSGFLQTWQRGQGDTWQHGKTTRKGLGGDNRERPHDKPSPAWLMTFKNVLIRLIGLLFSLSGLPPAVTGPLGDMWKHQVRWFTYGNQVHQEPVQDCRAILQGDPWGATGTCCGASGPTKENQGTNLTPMFLHLLHGRQVGGHGRPSDPANMARWIGPFWKPYSNENQPL